LYASKPDGSFAFASDPRQLLPFLGAAPSMSQAVVADFLNLGFVDHTKNTFFQGIDRVPAGCWAEFNISARTTAPNGNDFENWVQVQHYEARTAAEWVDMLSAAVAQSVKLRLTADVAVGSCLSGGLDSSLIVALARSELSNGPRGALVTVSAIYDDEQSRRAGLSEAPYLDAILSDQRDAALIVSPSGDDLLARFGDIARDQAEPFSHSSICLQWFVFKAARDAGLKVMLDGQGADELFGGYDYMAAYHHADLLKGGQWGDLLKSFAAQRTVHPESRIGLMFKAALIRSVPEGALRGMASLIGRFPPAEWPAPNFLPLVTDKFFNAPRYSTMTADLLERVSLPSLLRYEDRNSMAHGIESRLPFLSSEVSDIALSLPTRAKFEGGWSKEILRRVCEGTVPDQIVRRRRKLGFVTPQDHWMQTSWAPWARAHLDQVSRTMRGFVSDQALSRIDLEIGSNPNANAAAFRFASLNTWAEQFGVTMS
jgi:asparagine synthase (glutamine-hydrolysing)